MEGKTKRRTKSQPGQSQYEELNTGNDRKDEHAYSEVSLRQITLHVSLVQTMIYQTVGNVSQSESHK